MNNKLDDKAQQECYNTNIQKVIQQYSHELFEVCEFWNDILKQIFIVAQNNKLYIKDIINIWKTAKSLYGEVKLSTNEIIFFKIWIAEKINQEIEAYNRLSNRKHKNILGYGKLGELSIYFQEYMQWWSKNSIITHISQEIINPQTNLDLKENIKNIFINIKKQYDNNINLDLFNWKNDLFFEHRFYNWFNKDIEKIKNKNIIYRNEVFPLGSLFNHQLLINWINTHNSIESLIQEFNQPNSLKRRYATQSHGDITENNIAIDGTFFDFEVGWLNSLTQDIAITLHYFFISWHYLTPKYSTSFNNIPINKKDLLQKTQIDFSLEILDNVIKLNFNYQLPQIKVQILKLYFRYIIHWILEHPTIDKEIFLNLLKKDLAMRFLLTKNIYQLDQNDWFLLLWFASLIHNQWVNILKKYF